MFILEIVEYFEKSVSYFIGCIITVCLRNFFLYGSKHQMKLNLSLNISRYLIGSLMDTLLFAALMLVHMESSAVTPNFFNVFFFVDEILFDT